MIFTFRYYLCVWFDLIVNNFSTRIMTDIRSAIQNFEESERKNYSVKSPLRRLLVVSKQRLKLIKKWLRRLVIPFSVSQGLWRVHIFKGIFGLLKILRSTTGTLQKIWKFVKFSLRSKVEFYTYVKNWNCKMFRAEINKSVWSKSKKL